MCNVYRELDRGTAYFRGVLLDLHRQLGEVHNANIGKPQDSMTTKRKGSAPPLPASKRSRTTVYRINHKLVVAEDVNVSREEWTCIVLWYSYIYRQVNRMETFMEIGFPSLPKRGCKSVQSIESYLLQAENWKETTNQSFFTGAHQVSGYKAFASALVSVTEGGVVDEVCSDLCVKGATQADRITALQRLPNVGPFFSWQIYCDLCEARCFTMENAAVLGPGAEGTFVPFRSRGGFDWL
jgi:hypothetical protein